MNTHLHPLRAKRPSLGTNSVANRYFAGQRPYCVVTKAGDSQITIAGLDYTKIDINTDADARDYVMSLGYLQAPVVVAGGQHWSGYRPDRISAISKSSALSA